MWTIIDVCALIIDDDLRRHIVEGSDKWVYGEFSVDVVNERMESWYNKVCDKIEK